ncbi:hypothetical protein HanXRQr2_Chr15g0718781 [Helianthus annuus]|uniref:Uncharacterized protein n=1 Tax=Helianthus annuus TaxID=4232 RepID=A0A9K3H539_HELAN|nr:hypothetical protein HanXRQr2_Chr15g0718781 [Helianthus annuus]KAJ0833369.1 hypothetical protein HanPSC8_Chr15g0689601 [Helianthus annuus]
MLIIELPTDSCELMIFNNRSPANIPCGCRLSFTNLKTPTKSRKLGAISAPVNKTSISFTQSILVSNDPSFKTSTINEILVGCNRLVIASEFNCKLTNIATASDPTAWVVRGPNSEETKVIPPLSVRVFLAESWVVTSFLSSLSVWTRV